MCKPISATGATLKHTMTLPGAQMLHKGSISCRSWAIIFNWVIPRCQFLREFFDYTIETEFFLGSGKLRKMRVRISFPLAVGFIVPRSHVPRREMCFHKLVFRKQMGY